MADNSRRAFIRRAALGTAAILSYPAAQVLGANDRLRVGIIGAGGRGMDLVDDLRKVPSTQLVAVADVYRRRREEARRVVLTFSKTAKGARVDLVHANVPEHDHKGVTEGWRTYYWQPWRKYFAKQSQ